MRMPNLEDTPSRHLLSRVSHPVTVRNLSAVPTSMLIWRNGDNVMLSGARDSEWKQQTKAQRPFISCHDLAG